MASEPERIWVTGEAFPFSKSQVNSRSPPRFKAVPDVRQPRAPSNAHVTIDARRSKPVDILTNLTKRLLGLDRLSGR